MTARVYAYGCARPSKEIRAAVCEQLWLAYRYRYKLWQLAMAGREHYRELRRQHVPELLEAEAELARVTERLESIERDDEERPILREALPRLRARCKELRELAKSHAGLAADAAEGAARQAILQRALRKVFSRVLGLYSGTYLHVEAAARSANAGTEDPAKPYWRGYDVDGEGVLAIQLQGGRSVVDLSQGKDPSIHLELPNRAGKGARAGSRTSVHYRLRSDEKGKAVMIALPVAFYRDLPADARVTWAKLVVKRIHDFRFQYSLQFTVESSLLDPRSRGQGKVAICFAEDRVACLDDRGERFALPRFMEPQKLRDLQSIRDKHRNLAIGFLTAWCECQDETADWVRNEIALIEERKSCRRLYHLREKLRGIIDAELSRYLDEWAYRENHLYMWHNDLRTNALRQRKYQYRDFAARLRRRYDTIILDSRRLTFDKAPLTVERRWLGLSELRLVIAHANGDAVVSMTGDSCDAMLERYDVERNAESAREENKASENEASSKPKHVKRTGFARKHRERLETSRNATPDISE